MSDWADEKARKLLEVPPSRPLPYVGDDCPGGHAEVGEPKPLPLGHPYLRANDFDECGACGQTRSAHEPKP